MNVTRAGGESRSWKTIVFLCVLVFVLGLGNFYLAAHVSRGTKAASIDAPREADEIKAELLNAAKQAEPNPAKPPPFAWAPLESSDYKTYMANLRKLSFPEGLIREIIISDVNKLYGPREEALKIKQVPHDASLEARRRPPTEEDVANLTKLQQIEIERQGVLEDLLGERVPRELLRTPNSRNYEAREYAIGLLPPEKQDQVQRIEETEFLQDDLNQARNAENRDERIAGYRRIDDAQHAALQGILTPDEYDKYLMNTMPAGTELARRTIGMEATDEEMLKMWHLADAQWKDQGGVYGWWRTDPVPGQQIKEADERFEAGMKEALGDARYIDYKMAVSDTGQQLRNFAARYELPRETLQEAFGLQTEIDGSLNTTISEQKTAQMQKLLGPELWDAWRLGRVAQVNIQP